VKVFLSKITSGASQRSVAKKYGITTEATTNWKKKQHNLNLRFLKKEEEILRELNHLIHWHEFLMDFKNYLN
jgi:transposase-like protein